MAESRSVIMEYSFGARDGAGIKMDGLHMRTRNGEDGEPSIWMDCEQLVKRIQEIQAQGHTESGYPIALVGGDHGTP